MYKIIVRRNKDSPRIEKLYNTNDKIDAEKIYNHWILEAEDGNVIILISNGRETERKIKSGKSDMAVLKPKGEKNEN